MLERRNTENLLFLICRENKTPCDITHDIFNYILMRMLVILKYVIMILIHL